MKFATKLPVALLTLALLASMAPAEAAMQPDQTFVMSYFRSGDDAQKHLKKAGLSLMVGDERFAGDGSMFCVLYGRSSSNPGKDRGRVTVIGDLVTNQGSERVFVLRRRPVEDHRITQCVAADRMLNYGDVIVLRFKFKSMPKIQAGHTVMIAAVLVPMP